MPSRRSARVAGVPEDGTTAAMSSLPLPIVLHIFSLLPVDCRLRCLEVCRGWRAVLPERSLWTRLDLSATSGVRVPRRWRSWDALLRCAAARAGGGLLSLHTEHTVVTHPALLAVTAANAAALRELHVIDDVLTPNQVEALLIAAPQLRVFCTDLSCDDADVQAARRALRNEAPFGPLRVGFLHVDLRDEDEAVVVAFAADVAAHASLRVFSLGHAPLNTAAALDAVVDAALVRRLHTVALYDCRLSRASAPALARLLGGDALTTLNCLHVDLPGAHAADVLAAALRANATLTSLTMIGTGALHAGLLGALTGHVSLQVLRLSDRVYGWAAVGAALGALVAANAPSLTQLDVSSSNLEDAGLRPLFAALPRNTHLRTLDCQSNDMSAACGRDVLLPALRANTSLRSLDIGGIGDVIADVARELRSRAQQQ
jgi:hypothetical protein